MGTAEYLQALSSGAISPGGGAAGPALPSPGSLYGSALQSIQGFGAQQQADLKQDYTNAMGQAMQGLANMGLSGTTLAPSMRTGYFAQYSKALNRLNEQIQQQKLAAQSTFGLGGISAMQAGQQIGQQGALGQQSANVNQGYLALAQQQAGNQNAAYAMAAQDPANQGFNPGSYIPANDQAAFQGGGMFQGGSGLFG
jgi:hypothetical protein